MQDACLNIPERIEQETLIIHATLLLRERGYDERLLFAIPNGGTRSNKIEAANMKRGGVRAGIPDLMLAVPSQGFHGLFIEMKKRHGGTVSKAQKEVIPLLSAQGYRCEICRGFDEALGVLKEYLGIKV